MVSSLLSMAAPQSPSRKLFEQLKAGNTTEIYNHLDDIVYLQIQGDNGAYSKKQAKVILDKFFRYNKPKGFHLHLDRYKEESSRKYSIGELHTARGTFSVFLLMKMKGSNYTIKQIRFEKE